MSFYPETPQLLLRVSLLYDTRSEPWRNPIDPGLESGERGFQPLAPRELSSAGPPCAHPSASHPNKSIKGPFGSRIPRGVRVLLAAGSHLPRPLVSQSFDQTGLEFQYSGSDGSIAYQRADPTGKLSYHCPITSRRGECTLHPTIGLRMHIDILHPKRAIAGDGVLAEQCC